MIEIESFKNPKQNLIESIPNGFKLSIVNAMWELEGHNPITGEVVLEQHSGNLYCWIGDEWTQLCVAPEQETRIEPI